MLVLLLLRYALRSAPGTLWVALRSRKRPVLVLLLLLCATTTLTHAQQDTPPKTVNVPIMTYHYVSINPDPQGDPARTRLSVEPKTLAAQLDWLQANGYTTVTLDDVYYALDFGFDLPSKPIVLTFDDGYRDFYTEAWPLLKARNMQATIYLISSVLGQPPYLTLSMVQELASSPLITIGAHTETHRPLASIRPEQSREEIVGSKRAIELLVGRRIAHFCYPYGNYNDAVAKQVQAAGFVTATTTKPGRTHNLQRWTWSRITVQGGQPLGTFVASLQ